MRMFKLSIALRMTFKKKSEKKINSFTSRNGKSLIGWICQSLGETDKETNKNSLASHPFGKMFCQPPTPPRSRDIQSSTIMTNQNSMEPSANLHQMQNLKDWTVLYKQKSQAAVTLSVHAVSRSVHAVTLSVHAVSRSVHAVSRSVHAVSLSVHAVSQSVHAVSQSVHAVSQSMQLLCQSRQLLCQSVQSKQLLSVHAFTLSVHAVTLSVLQLLCESINCWPDLDQRSNQVESVKTHHHDRIVLLFVMRLHFDCLLWDDCLIVMRWLFDCYHFRPDTTVLVAWA